MSYLESPPQTGANPVSVGGPFVTVGVGSKVTFGPTVTPTSTTSGMQEALNAVTTVSNPYYGYSIWVIGPGALITTTQIVIPTGVTIYFPNNGGEGYGPVYVTPTTYFEYTGPANLTACPAAASGYTGIFPFVIADQSANIALYGWACLSNVAGLTGVMQVTGSRGVYTENLSCTTFSTSYAAFQIDGWAHNCEDNYMASSFLSGSPGLMVNIAGSAMKANNWLFAAPTVEGPWVSANSAFQVQAGFGAVMSHGGGDIQFENFYTRGDTATNANAYQVYLVDATAGAPPTFWFYGGEQNAQGGGGLWRISSGTISMSGGNLAAGTLLLDGAANFAQLNIAANCLVQCKIEQQRSNTLVIYDETVDVSSGKWVSSAGTLIPPEKTVATGAASLGWSTFTNTGASVEIKEFYASGNGQGGHYQATNNGGIQQFVNDVENGVINAGSVLRVATDMPTLATLNIGTSLLAVPAEGFRIYTGLTAPSNQTVGPVITAVNYSSLAGHLTGTSIEGFVLGLVYTNGQTNTISKNYVRYCVIQNTGNNSAIVHYNNTAGCEYFHFVECFLSSGLASHATPAPFFDVQGTASTSNGHYFMTNCVALIANGGNITTFTQIEQGVNFGPPVYFVNLDYTSLNTTGDVFYNVVGGTTSTACPAVVRGGYFEGRPITAWTIGAFTGAATMTGQMRMTDALISVVSGPFQCVNCSNTSWSSRDNGVSVSGTIESANEDTNIVLNSSVAQATGATAAVLTGLGVAAGTGKFFGRFNVTSGPRGFTISTPTLSGINSTVYAVNTFCFPVEVSFTAAGTATVIKVQDYAGTVTTYTLAPTVIDKFILNPGEQIAVTWSAAPTWVWRGL